MRIAQVSPLFESVPPKLYGGTERVVSYLTEELVKMGHEVTLFASGDSQTSARLVSPCSQALRLEKRTSDPVAYHVFMLERVMREIESFDLVHAHLDYLPWPLFRRHPTPFLTTLHGRLDLAELKPILREYQDIPLVSISNEQRRPAPQNRWMGTVYHGLPPELLRFQPDAGRYLAFLGRISIEKRVDRAVEIARRTGVPLKVAAKVDPRDVDYFHRVAEPLLKDPWCEFIGEIGEDEKSRFLGEASALLFPIDWPEPFGMVLIESMACGTPVIAYGSGSVPEIIEEGVTGFIVNSVGEAMDAVQKIPTLSRARIRAEFERRFTARRMAGDYLKIYEALVDQGSAEEAEGNAIGVLA